jgi:N-acetylglucosamine-6-sulfatase
MWKAIPILCLLAWSGCTEEKAERPNVILIVSDDHRADLMGCAGHPYLETPHLDKIAENGMYFANAFCVTGVCSPSRASILTGKYAHNAAAPYIVRDNNSFDLQETFVEKLHENGYYTGHIGKWHLGEGDKKHEGYDYWAGFEWLGKFFDTEVSINGDQRQFTGFSDDILSDLAVDFIRDRHNSNQPFALYVGLKSPHMPFSYPERHNDLLAGVQIPKPGNFDEDYVESGKTGLINNYIRIKTAPFGLPGWKTWDRYIKSYYRSTRAVDDAVGKILQVLDDLQISDNTMVIYTSDQGYSNGEHGLTEKHFAYEQVMKVPLLIQYPKAVRPGSSTTEMVMLPDLAPTILDLCGVAPLSGVDGKSLRPLLYPTPGRHPFREEVFFYYHSFPKNIPAQMALRTSKYKIIDYPYGNTEELYDLTRDPQENTNVAFDPGYAGVLKEMKARLQRNVEENGWALRKRVPAQHIAFVTGIAPEHVEQVAQKVILEGKGPSIALDDTSYTTEPRSQEDGRYIVHTPNPGSPGLAVLRIENERRQDLYTSFFFSHLRPKKIYTADRIYYNGDKDAPGDIGNNFNPGLHHGENLILFEFRPAAMDTISITMDVPGNWVYIK